MTRAAAPRRWLRAASGRLAVAAVVTRTRAARGRLRAASGRLAAVAVALVALTAPTVATAQDCPQTTLAAVEADVMCPVCGTPLGLATEAPQANRQRALIQRLVDRCYSKERIEDVLVAQYGPSVLALPEPEGFDLAAYVVPGLGVLVAALALLFAARRWRRSGSDGDPTATGEATEGAAAGDGADVDSTVAKRLAADLERYEL